ncbi:sulfotransferase [Desulfurobacterium sp.]|uniref:sulfotransferase n=1 Tax=Desulfurobacterium sp. TaxID=2004706 RepID=UPI00261CB8A4|nr:sulfotransferase [Desulfurobacterium sp.]
MRRPLVIIIGMHRSGTSMLSRILGKLGIFMGWKKEQNNEALFFLRFNDWVLKQAHASWDNPYNYTLAGPDFRELMTELANKYIKSIRRVQYLGFPDFFKYRSLKELDFPWGWKDPRNTFTLDIWLKVFPNAKIIHIYRNPIDVAESLRKRTLKYRKNFEWNFKKNVKLLLTRGYIGYGNSVRVENILEGIKL